MRASPDNKVTTYGYDPNTGELTSVDYDAAWNMTDLAYTYDRLGRRATVTDAAGTRAFAYNSVTLLPTTETLDANGMFSGKVITQVYQDGSGGTVAGRWAGVQVGTSNDPDAEYAAAYGFDAYGRLNHVTGPGLPTGDGTNNGAWYSFVSGSELVDQLLLKNSSAAVKAWVDWSYEDERDLVAAVENNFGDLSTYTTLSKYAYGNDGRGRRSYVIRTGSAFAQGHQDAWGYDDRDELTAARRYNNTTPESTQNPDTSLDRVYAYDPIGNRTLGRDGTDPNTVYTANNLNQYDPVTKATSPETAQRLSYDADGNLVDAYLAGDVDGDGNVNQQDYGALLAAYGKCEGDQDYDEAANLANSVPGACDPNQGIDNADLGVLLAYYGLNATSTLRAKLTWDAENRLVRFEPLLFTDGAKKVEFAYDYLGRRVEKKVYEWDNGDWEEEPTVWRRYVWYNWLMVQELDVSDAGETIAARRHYTWGLDLAGQSGALNSLESAGGIGGLLAARDPNDPADGSDPYGDFIYFYDANGNVGQLLSATADPNSAAVVSARYEYDAYGNVTAQSGWYAAENPTRFSTKYWDDETGFGYWGFRYYLARLGRWTSRDVIEEEGGYCLYGALLNRPSSVLDGLGAVPISLRFNAFIPDRLGQFLPEPVPFSPWDFGTDNRTAGVTGTSRLNSEVVIDPELLCKGGAIISVSVWSDGTSRRNRYSEEHQSLVSAPASTFSASERPCRAEVGLYASGIYPFAPRGIAPSLDFSIKWTVQVFDINRVAITLSGTHDAFPDYEGLINSFLIYHYHTSFGGPSHWSLGSFGAASGGPLPRGIRTKYSWYQLVTATPTCCPRLSLGHPTERP